MRFQVLGFDVLLDSKARPWLLEMNDHPSFRIDLSFDEPGQYSLNGLNSIPSPVDEAIKVPMLAAALQVVAKECGLRVRRPRKPKKGMRAKGTAAAGSAADADADAADADTDADDDGRDEYGSGGRESGPGSVAKDTEASADDDDARFATGGVYGTGFYEVMASDEAAKEGFELLTRLTTLFVEHTPPSVRREEADPSRVRSLPPSDSLAVPGPRWKGAAAFVSFLQAGGVLPKGFGGGGALKRPDVDIIVLSVCGKGGSMDVLDFCEACAKVARRLWPDRADDHPSELLNELLDTYFPSS